MHSLSADNRHIGRYIVQSADYRIYADYLQYRIGRISVSANFPNLDIVCTLVRSYIPMHEIWAFCLESNLSMKLAKLILNSSATCANGCLSHLTINS